MHALVTTHMCTEFDKEGELRSGGQSIRMKRKVIKHIKRRKKGRCRFEREKNAQK